MNYISQRANRAQSRTEQTVSNDTNYANRTSESSARVNMLPLAASYVPFQVLDTVFEPMEALTVGTLFPELDKPFLGKTIQSEGRRR